MLQFELYRRGSPAIWAARKIAPDDQVNRDFYSKNIKKPFEILKKQIIQNISKILIILYG